MRQNLLYIYIYQSYKSSSIIFTDKDDTFNLIDVLSQDMIECECVKEKKRAVMDQWLSGYVLDSG